MGLENSIEKLDKYFDRLSKGKAKKIKPEHLEKIVRKLMAKEKILLSEIEETAKESKKSRLKRKLSLVHEQQERANWLRDKISD